MSVPLDFLEKLRPGGPWVLTAIAPDGPITTVTARTADEVERFVNAHNDGRNLYYSVNPTRTAMDKKAKKTDIAAIEFALADLDPADGETPEQAKARYLADGPFEPKPTATVDSGNGIQCFWRFDKPIPLGEPTRNEKGELTFSPEDRAKIDDVEARIAAIMLRLNAKPGTQNIDRILRLPGTTNLPNKKKRREGRGECPTRLMSFNGVAHPLAAFPSPDASKSSTGTDEQSTPGRGKREAIDVDALPVSDRIKKLIRGIDDPEHPYSSRSERVMAVLVAMAGSGCTDERWSPSCSTRLCQSERTCAISRK
jgi:hypothetical protein